MELSEVNSIKIENIYLIIKEFHSKAIDSFLHSTQQFIHESNYNDYVTHIESQLNSLEAELINNYAFTKYEYGQRILKDLEKKKGKKGAFDNYSFMRIIGRE
jgi:heme oxygenase